MKASLFNFEKDFIEAIQQLLDNQKKILDHWVSVNQSLKMWIAQEKSKDLLTSKKENSQI